MPLKMFIAPHYLLHVLAIILFHVAPLLLQACIGCNKVGKVCVCMCACMHTTLCASSVHVIVLLVYVVVYDWRNVRFCGVT